MRIALLLTLALVAAAHAQSQPATGATTPPAGVDAKLWELLNLDRANRGFKESKAKDAPIVALSGNLGSGPANDPMKVASDFVTRFGTVLGFPEKADLKALTEPVDPPQTTSAGTLLALAPAVAHVPYVNAAVHFTVDPTGKLTAVTGRYHAPDGARMGSLSAADAVRLALYEVRKKMPDADLTGDGQVAEALVPLEAGGLEHRYTVSLTVGRPPVQKDVTLGPGGEVVHVEEGSQSSDPDASVDDTYPPATPTVQPLDDLVNPAVHDAKWGLLGGVVGVGVGALVGALSDYKIFGSDFESDSSWSVAAADRHGNFRYDPFQGDHDHPMLANPPFLECTVYYWLVKERKQMIAWGASEADTDRLVFDVWRPRKYDGDKDLKSNWELANNAQFNGSDDRLEFCAVNDRHEERSPAMDATVVYHEYGHKVHRLLSEHYYQGGTNEENQEARAVSEGFGDTCAAAMTHEPTHASWWSLGKPGRTADNTYTFATATPIDEDSPTTEIHQAGQLISGLFWDMQKKFGVDDAMRLMISALRVARTPHSFHNVATGLVTAIVITPGQGAHLVDLVTILNARGLLGSTVSASNPGGD